MFRRLVHLPRLYNGFRRTSSQSSLLTLNRHFSSPAQTTHHSSPSLDEAHSDTPNEASESIQPSSKLSIDRSGLFNPPEHSHEHSSSDSEIVKHLKGIIKFRGGPISVAEYMEEVLTNPKAGYYMNRDVFGSVGDFVTSPEVSQMFGEMVGVWVICLWEQMGQPDKVNLIELGPGRGTLMADLLRGASKFEKFTKSLHVHIVECSPTLQKLQYQTLKCADEDVSESKGVRKTVSMFAGAPVSWHTTLEQVPSGVPAIIIGHEFFDALPIHQFQVCFLPDHGNGIAEGDVNMPVFPMSFLKCLNFKASRGWSEKMVDLADDSLQGFRFVLSPQPTPALLSLMKRCKWAVKEEISRLDQLEDCGEEMELTHTISKLQQIEVCPKGMELAHTIAERIGSDGGGALIIDYGQNEIVSDSLQAIRKHKFVDILDNPGSADLSAYVDFASIRHSAEEASENVSVHGPMSQSQFLGALGINFRVESLMENCTDEQAELLRSGYWRLVGEGEAPFWEGPEDQTPIGMGTRYLAMAIVNKNQGVPVPFQ